VVLSLVLLFAHFLRLGHPGLIALSLAVFALLRFKQTWARRALQAWLVFGALVWADAAAEMIALRRAIHAPYARLALIMSAAAGLTCLSILILQNKKRRCFSENRRVNVGEDPAAPSPDKC